MDFNELAPILEAAGMAAAKHEAIDFAELAHELDEAVAEIEPIWRQFEWAGLVYFASLGETHEYPELRQIFEFFGDDDVLDMFDMREPADAAVAADSPINKKMGIVDQRLEAWFHPFGSVVETGYLRERS